MTGNQGRILRIAGVPGCGKSALTTKVSIFASNAENMLYPVDVCKIQCEIAGVGSEKQYREIPEETRRGYFADIMNRIAEISNMNPRVLWFFERHLCSMNDNKTIIKRGIPDIHGIHMSGMAVVLADVEQIMYWRNQDKSIRQDRHQLTCEQIEIEQNTEVEVALVDAERWGFPVRFFTNKLRMGDEVAFEIFSFFKSIN